jgi:hypothetical protein
MALVMDEMRLDEHVAVITGAGSTDWFRCAELVTT